MDEDKVCVVSREGIEMLAKMVFDDPSLNGKHLMIAAVVKVDQDGNGITIIEQSIQVVEREEESNDE